MKILYLILAALLLAGCASTADGLPPSEPAEPIPETVPSTDMPSVERTAPVLQTIPPTEAPDPLQLLLDCMTIEERVGQIFLARCPETGAAEDAAAYHLGGYILFGRDFEGQTPDSIRNLLTQYNEDASIPLLIAVDEEGGTVTRVSRVAAFRTSRFLSPRDYYARGGMEAVLAAEEEKCALLKDLGINVNMGPVADITTRSGAFMYLRSLGQPPEITSTFVCSTVDIMAGSNIGSVLKHFPGYGNNSDTHTGISVDPRPLQELEQQDLIPFRSGIEAGCGAILVSHSIVTAFDDTLPASLSPAVHDYLRQKMGFDGVIITDDLVMEAITQSYGSGESAVLAVLAGNDLLCCSDYPAQYQAVLCAVLEGRIPMDRLDEAVMRVLRWKQQLGLLEN